LTDLIQKLDKKIGMLSMLFMGSSHRNTSIWRALKKCFVSFSGIIWMTLLVLPFIGGDLFLI